MERGHLKFQHVKKGDGPPHRGYPDMKHGHVSWYIEEVERDNQKTAVEQAKEGGQVTSLARYDDSQSRIKNRCKYVVCFSSQKCRCEASRIVEIT